MSPAPIALFTYNRPAHTARVVESLLRNREAADSELYVFSDAPKTSEAEPAVRAVRDYIRTIRGFRSLEIVERDRNFGLAGSIIDGVTRLCASHGQAVVLEDDILVSPFFLRYVNEALHLYADEERVLSIAAYMYPVRTRLPETLFLHLPDCWGWAVWKRSWDLFEPDGALLLSELRRRGLEEKFDFESSFPFMRMLEDQVAGRNDSWAVRWYAKALLHGGLTLYPGRAMTANIGMDGSGIHSGRASAYDVELADAPILLNASPVQEDRLARAQIASFFRTVRPSRWRVLLRQVISRARLRRPRAPA